MGFQLKNKFQILCSLFIFIIGISFPSFISVTSSDIGGVFVSEQIKELRCLEAVLWAEARSEPEAGIRAVMSVIYNRKNHKNYPSSFCGVILQHKQFSAFDNNKGLATKALKLIGSKDKQAHAVVSYVAHQAILGRFEPVLDMDVLWYAKHNTNKPWMKRLKIHKKIGGHKFYGI